VNIWHLAGIILGPVLLAFGIAFSLSACYAALYGGDPDSQCDEPTTRGDFGLRWPEYLHHPHNARWRDLFYSGIFLVAAAILVFVVFLGVL
jgi:hypothetical protein